MTTAKKMDNFRVLAAICIVICGCRGEGLDAGNDVEDARSTRILNQPAADPKLYADRDPRFMGAEALDSLGKLFLLSNELSSCYSCSVSFPMHASACCSQGYYSCCANDNFYSGTSDPFA